MNSPVTRASCKNEASHLSPTPKPCFIHLRQDQGDDIVKTTLQMRLPFPTSPRNPHKQRSFQIDD